MLYLECVLVEDGVEEEENCWQYSHDLQYLECVLEEEGVEEGE